MTTNPLPDPEVFMEAARLIGERQEMCCCKAISVTLGMRWVSGLGLTPVYNTPEVKLLTALFMPDGLDSPKLSWWSHAHWHSDYPPYIQEGVTTRIIALTICAEVARDIAVDLADAPPQ